ncbi:MAG: Hsp20/alpha crystallin family protein [Desulfobacteraceae bacterium]|jgi:HSP20 family protein|nr:Hsp20/alpha crystallin family protein [Desulfobacteraceae bacterium]
MTELTLWKKEELDKLKKDLDFRFSRFRRGFGVPHALLERTETFATSLTDTGDYLILKTELPGVQADNIQLSVNEDTLSMAVKSSEDSVEKGPNFQNFVKRRRSFSNAIKLPCRIVVEDVKATYQDNILKIKLRKYRPKEAHGINIEVK